MSVRSIALNARYVRRGRSWPGIAQDAGSVNEQDQVSQSVHKQVRAHLNDAQKQTSMPAHASYVERTHHGGRGDG